STWFAVAAAGYAHTAGAKADEALRQRDQADHSLYVANLQLAQRAWQDVDIPHMTELLTALIPTEEGRKDFRGFEWRYLWRLAHPDVVTLRDGAGLRNCLAYSPDGRFLAASTGGVDVVVWGVADH